MRRSCFVRRSGRFGCLVSLQELSRVGAGVEAGGMQSGPDGSAVVHRAGVK